MLVWQAAELYSSDQEITFITTFLRSQMSLLQSRNPSPTRAYYNNTGSRKPFKEAAHPFNPRRYKAHAYYRTGFPQICHTTISFQFEQERNV